MMYCLLGKVPGSCLPGNDKLKIHIPSVDCADQFYNNPAYIQVHR